MATTTSNRREYQERSVRRLISWVLLAVGAAVFVWQGWTLSSRQAAIKEANDAREAAEEARDEMLERSELIVLSSPVALIMCGESREITICNPAAEEMFGYTNAELVGKPIDMLLPKNFARRHREVFHHAIVEAKSKRDNYLMRRTNVPGIGIRKDGSEIKVLLAIRVIKYGDSVEFIAAMREPGDTVKDERIPLPPLQPRRNRIMEQIQRQADK